MSDTHWCKPVERDGRSVCEVCGFDSGQLGRFIRVCGTRPTRLASIQERKANPPRPRKLLGDRIEDALILVGVTKERVEKWVGGPCGCTERQERLNRLDLWVRRVVGGKVVDAAEALGEMLDEQNQ